MPVGTYVLSCFFYRKKYFKIPECFFMNLCITFTCVCKIGCIKDSIEFPSNNFGFGSFAFRAHTCIIRTIYTYYFSFFFRVIERKMPERLSCTQHQWE